jgi:glycosyltransferase involved in cell wall biosynthesis
VRVLFVQSFLHARGGDTTCASLLREALGDLGVETLPFAMRHPDNDPSPWETRFPPWRNPRASSALERARAAAGSIWSARSARDLRTLLADVRPDVAHLHHVHRHLTPSVLWPLRDAGVPVVWTAHDYELLCPAGTLHAARIDPPGVACTRCTLTDVRPAVQHRCKRDDTLESAAFAFEKLIHGRLRVLDRVDRVVAPSRFLADRFLERGVPAERVRHIPNGVRLAPPGPPAAHDAPIVFAGRLAVEKGVDDVLAVARALPRRDFRMIGAGQDAERLRREAPPNVTFTGALDAASVAEELRRAAVVLVPSRWPENDPYAVIEAQLAGRPVVATAVGGIPEQIRDGEDGRLVPPGDAAALTAATAALLDDSREARRIGATAHRRIIAERAPGPWAHAIRALYRELLG